MGNSLRLLLTLYLTHFTTAKFSAQDCAELGFVKSSLQCSSCEKLDDYGLELLKPDCKQCCTPDQHTNVQRRYPKAILEVCTCKFRAYPQIQAFIKSDRPAKFPNLKLKYVRGLDPIIKLLDADDNVKETLSITKWNTDAVEEFFETHLEKIGIPTGKSAYSVVEEEDDDNDDFLRTNLI